MSARAALLAVMAGASLLAFGACGANKPPETKEIVTAVPWTGAEAYTYDLVDSKKVKHGEGTLSIVPNGDGWIISQDFADPDGNADRSQIAVMSSLLPVAGRRTIVSADENRREELTTSYGELNDGSHGVRIRQQTYKPRDRDEASSTRCNPNKLPTYSYDNDSSLFLWRTIKFEQGYEVTYTASIANRRAERPLTLRVRRQERVTTPAGEFDAWLVGIEGEGETQEAWFSTEPDHKLLVYDNDREVFLYTGETEPPKVDDAPATNDQLCEKES